MYIAWSQLPEAKSVLLHAYNFVTFDTLERYTEDPNPTVTIFCKLQSTKVCNAGAGVSNPFNRTVVFVYKLNKKKRVVIHVKKEVSYM